MAIRQMALTPSLVAQIHRVVEDPGPDPNVVYHTEETGMRWFATSCCLMHPTKTSGSLPMVP